FSRDWSSDVCSSDLLYPPESPTFSFILHPFPAREKEKAAQPPPAFRVTRLSILCPNLRHPDPPGASHNFGDVEKAQAAGAEAVSLPVKEAANNGPGPCEATGAQRTDPTEIASPPGKHHCGRKPPDGQARSSKAGITSVISIISPDKAGS